MSMKLAVLIAIGLVGGAATTRADVTLLLEEPLPGTFGGMNPTGHAAIYLSRICAASPLTLRRCKEGEQGVVLSRYHRIAGYDWLAMPVIPYLCMLSIARSKSRPKSERDVAFL